MGYSVKELKQETGAPAPPPRRVAGSLNGVGVRWMAGSGQKGGSGVGLPTSSGVLCLDHALYPDFALSTSAATVGFWLSCVLLCIIGLNCACMKLLLVSYSFFVFCCLRKHLCRYKHSSKGSSASQPVSETPEPNSSQGS